jgi:transposase
MPSKKEDVIDNASYHISDETREIIEDAGCYLIYLPPYSPQLNKIENYWAKKYLRKLLFLFDSIDDALFYIFNHIKVFNILLGA